MHTAHKKALMLLKCIFFHYQGLDQAERKLLDESAQTLDALEELNWANQFIARDQLTAFERARNFLNHFMTEMDRVQKLEYLNMAWKVNRQKGYITEMEATAMLKIAKDWQLESELMSNLRKQT